MANSTEYIISLTPEDVAVSILIQLSKDRYQKQSPKEDIIGNEVASTPSLQVNQAHHNYLPRGKRLIKKQDENSKCEEKDDSEQTLRYMVNYKENTPDYPPERIFIHDPDAVGDCSKPIRKQLKKSDVKNNQCRLMLGQEQVEKMMLDVLKLGSDGLDVSVYEQDGEIHEIMFKKWIRLRQF